MATSTRTSINQEHNLYVLSLSDDISTLVETIKVMLSDSKTYLLYVEHEGVKYPATVSSRSKTTAYIEYRFFVNSNDLYLGTINYNQRKTPALTISTKRCYATSDLWEDEDYYYTAPPTVQSVDQKIMTALSDVKQTIINCDASNIKLLSCKGTWVIDNEADSLEITLPSPTEGVDYNCEIIFKATDNFNLIEHTPEGCVLKKQNMVICRSGKIYKATYNCLWLKDNDKTILTADYTEFNI